MTVEWSPWQVIFVVSSDFTLMESEPNHDGHTVPQLAHSHVLCSSKYRYAHTKVSLTSPTHLREHIKGHIHSVATIMTTNTSGCLKTNGDLALRWVNVSVPADGVDVSDNLTIDNIVSKYIFYDSTKLMGWSIQVYDRCISNTHSELSSCTSSST